tara:strand:- start:266 stop:655 length:390 start_codon:yes stop_codon:yes gene_type:complete
MSHGTMTFNLTEKKISETFQKLVQIQNEQLYDLEGNYVHDLTVQGQLTGDSIKFSDGTVQSTATAFGTWHTTDTFQSSSVDVRISGIVSASGDFVTEQKLQLGKLETVPEVIEGAIYYDKTDGEFYLGK